MTDTNLIDPATLSGTELLLRQKHCPETLTVSSSEALQAPISVEVLPVHKNVNNASQGAAESDVDVKLLQERARKLVEAAKKAQEDKNK